MVSAGTSGHLNISVASLHSSSDGLCLGVGLAGEESLSSVQSSAAISSCTEQDDG